jgi:PAS domain S-box-containing protein
VPQDKIPGILRLLRGLAQQIARHSLAEKQAHLAHAEIERLVAKRTQELQESEERFRAFMDHAPAVAWIKDDTGRFAYVSRVWEEHFGMSSAEIIGKTDLDLWPVKMAAKFRTDDATVLESGCPIRTEEAVAKKDGKEDYWLTYKFPLGERAGRRYVGGMALDISGRRKMEDDLREHRAHLEELVEVRTRELLEIVSLNATILATSVVGIAAYRHDGRCIMANPSFCRIVGGTEEQLLGQNFRQIDSWTLSGVLEAAENVLGTGQDVELETELTSTFGRHLWLRCHLSRFVSDGDPHLLLMLHDVSDAKAAEKDLQTAKAEADHANNAKSRFLAAASHDLRQPLSAISLYTDTLAEKLEPADAQLARNMKDCIKNLNELLSSLLDLSRLDAHVVVPNIADFELGTVIQNVVAAFEPEAKLKRLPLRYRDMDAIGRTDPVLFKRIIGNLVSNAIRYTDLGGILIGFRRRHGKTWVEVWDTGIGIPADKTTEIFEEFRQLGNAERNRAKGTGLGLTIVARTAALLGLQVRVRSMHGRGSMFAVEVPQGKAVSRVTQREYPHRPLQIALVEDNAEVATALVHALTSVGHRVVSATSRAELLPRINGIKPNIVISDYRLAGDEDGIAVIGACRAIFGDDLPALIITGDTDPAAIRRMTEERISIQHKPLDLVALRTRIAELTA